MRLIKYQSTAPAIFICIPAIITGVPTVVKCMLSIFAHDTNYA